MPEVTTTCQKCGCQYQWFMSHNSHMPDCPDCGFNPDTALKNSGVNALIGDLKHLQKRNNAAVALGDMGATEAIEPLLEIFINEREKTPPSVLVALGSLHAEPAVGLLLELLDEHKNEPDHPIHIWSTRALVRMGTLDALKGAIKNLKLLYDLYNKDTSELRDALQAYIAQGKDAVPILIEGLRDHCYFDAVRREYIWALGELQDKRAIDIIREQLNDKTKEIVNAAGVALVKLGCQEPDTDALSNKANLEKYGMPELIDAVEQGDVKKIKQLLDAGIDPNSEDDDTVYTILYTATESGNTEIVKLLLENGADVDAVVDYGQQDGTPLIKASFDGHAKIAEILLEAGADIEATNDNMFEFEPGPTALFYATSNGHADVVRILLNYGANTEHTDYSGNTPLMEASSLGHNEIVKLLLDSEAQNNTESVQQSNDQLLVQETTKKEDEEEQASALAAMKSKQTSSSEHRKNFATRIEICPECGARYGFLDRLLQKEMCSRCRRKFNPDLFLGEWSECWGRDKVAITDQDHFKISQNADGTIKVEIIDSENLIKDEHVERDTLSFTRHSNYVIKYVLKMQSSSKRLTGRATTTSGRVDVERKVFRIKWERIRKGVGPII